MNLLCFGLGYSARRVADEVLARGWQVSGTTTTDEGVARLTRRGIEAFRFDGRSADDALLGAISGASHLLVSVPPDHETAHDPVIAECGDAIQRAGKAGKLKWIGYLSTIGVYGDHDGAWIDEQTPPTPQSSRSVARLKAELAWRDLAQQSGAKLQILRLAGIYGPGRSAFDRLRRGTAQRIVKPGQVFNRIHVDDIAAAVLRGLDGHGSETLYNVCDDLPAPPQDVIAHAAELMGVPAPPEIDIDEADLSPMARSFYSENKRCRNDRLKFDLGVVLAHPTYREGLKAILESETGN